MSKNLEGTEIAFSDVRVGDKITGEWETKDGSKTSATGVVDTLTAWSAYSSNDTVLFASTDSPSKRITSSKITLLERESAYSKARVGSVATLSNYLYVKIAENSWRMLHKNGSWAGDVLRRDRHVEYKEKDGLVLTYNMPDYSDTAFALAG